MPEAPLPEGPLLTVCSRGTRAMTAASLAARRGADVAVLSGGSADLAHAAGTVLQTGA
jgi:rhodanese-related sulfurtransferase